MNSAYEWWFDYSSFGAFWGFVKVFGKNSDVFQYCNNIRNILSLPL